MQHEVEISIVGLGIIFYSPSSVSHIPTGADYLQSDFWAPADVARHVMDCQISAFGTGGPGDYVLRVFDGPFPDSEIDKADKALRLGIEVKDGALHFNDLYALMDWDPQYSEKIPMANGFYRITVFVTFKDPESDDPQVISMLFEPWAEKPSLRYEGAPGLV